MLYLVCILPDVWPQGYAQKYSWNTLCVCWGLKVFINPHFPHGSESKEVEEGEHWACSYSACFLLVVWLEKLSVGQILRGSWAFSCSAYGTGWGGAADRVPPRDVTPASYHSYLKANPGFIAGMGRHETANNAHRNSRSKAQGTDLRGS